ncbi:MAG: 1-acyl-sn-glycerol-3-phosphate acyltransferase, partial [Planctomycetes bacterium]|nr:1-acyl-sn-glycerol-3-phosphate acyltransferase [Planctomycetota bacterium]
MILASNHQSFLDPVLVAIPLSRGVTFMARDSLFRFLPFRVLIESLGAFPVQRGTADLGAMREAIRRLGAGQALLVFPEGTRTTDGGVGRMRAGIGLLASRARVPVVPVRISGAFESWPRGLKLPRPKPVTVRYGPALPSEIACDPDRVGPALEAALEQLRPAAPLPGVIPARPAHNS